MPFCANGPAAQVAQEERLGKALWKKCVLLTPYCGYPHSKNANVV
jgi:hypothetical protein